MYLGRGKISKDVVQAYLWFDLAASSYNSMSQGIDFSKQSGEAISLRDEVQQFELLQFAADCGEAHHIEVHYNTNGSVFPEHRRSAKSA